MILILGGVVAVVFKNRNYTTRFWPGASDRDVSTLWLMLATATTAVMLFKVMTRIRRVFREWVEVRSEQERQVQLAEQMRLKKELADAERRLNERLDHKAGDHRPGGPAEPG